MMPPWYVIIASAWVGCVCASVHVGSAMFSARHLRWAIFYGLLLSLAYAGLRHRFNRSAP